MAPRTALVSVLALGLVGAGIYAAPCLMGPCEDQGSVVAGEADEPCDTPCDGKSKGKTLAAGEEAPCDEPCDPPCDDEKAKVLAAGAGGEEPCPFAAKAEAEVEEPCPHAAEQALAAQADASAPTKESAPIAAAVPQT